MTAITIQLDSMENCIGTARRQVGNLTSVVCNIRSAEYRLDSVVRNKRNVGYRLNKLASVTDDIQFDLDRLLNVMQTGIQDYKRVDDYLQKQADALQGKETNKFYEFLKSIRSTLYYTLPIDIAKTLGNVVIKKGKEIASQVRTLISEGGGWYETWQNIKIGGEVLLSIVGLTVGVIGVVGASAIGGIAIVGAAIVLIYEIESSMNVLNKVYHARKGVYDDGDDSNGIEVPELRVLETLFVQTIGSVGKMFGEEIKFEKVAQGIYKTGEIAIIIWNLKDILKKVTSTGSKLISSARLTDNIRLKTISYADEVSKLDEIDIFKRRNVQVKGFRIADEVQDLYTTNTVNKRKDILSDAYKKVSNTVNSKYYPKIDQQINIQVENVYSSLFKIEDNIKEKVGVGVGAVTARVIRKNPITSLTQPVYTSLGMDMGKEYANMVWSLGTIPQVVDDVMKKTQEIIETKSIKVTDDNKKYGDKQSYYSEMDFV